MAEAARERLVLSPAHDAELEAAHLVEKIGETIDFPRDTLAEIKVAVVEACLNALEYGRGTVEVEVSAHDGEAAWIEVIVVDEGPGFDPDRVARPSLERKLQSERKRGWGLELIRHFMDDVEIVSRPGRTEVHMTRHRRGE